jgi:hypothetical protein
MIVLSKETNEILSLFKGNQGQLCGPFYVTSVKITASYKKQ